MSNKSVAPKQLRASVDSVNNKGVAVARFLISQKSDNGYLKYKKYSFVIPAEAHPVPGQILVLEDYYFRNDFVEGTFWLEEGVSVNDEDDDDDDDLTGGDLEGDGDNVS